MNVPELHTSSRLSVLPKARPLISSIAVSALGHLVLLLTPFAPPSSYGHGSLPAAFVPTLRAELAPSGSPPSTGPIQDHGSLEDGHAPQSLKQQRGGIAKPTSLPKFPAYYRSSDLAVAPEPLDPVAIPEPPVKDLATGTVSLRLYISANGEVEKIEVISSSLPELYEEEATTAFRAVPFSPGKLDDGNTVPAIMDVEVIFGRGGSR